MQPIELGVVVAGQRQRLGGIRVAGLERLDDFFLVGAGCHGELVDRRRPAELAAQLLDQLRELEVQLLEAARNVHRPAAVAEVALDLADDRRHGVRLERHPAVEVEAVDRLDQPDRADLDQVVEWFALAGIATGDRPHERHVLFDQLVARPLVAFLVVCP